MNYEDSGPGFMKISSLSLALSFSATDSPLSLSLSLSLARSLALSLFLSLSRSRSLSLWVLSVALSQQSVTVGRESSTGRPPAMKYGNHVT